MRKQIFTALLFAGALAILPIGGTMQRGVVSASGNTWLDAAESEIANAEAGSTVRWKGVNTLPNSIMKTLLAKKTVSLVLEYTYEGQNYVVTIPAGAAVNDGTPWYGPLYLAGRYGNGIVPAVPAVPAAAPGSVYIVKAGDTMNKIAKDNNMTLEQLAAKNPQIQNVNLIRVGETIKLQ